MKKFKFLQLAFLFSFILLGYHVHANESLKYLSEEPPSLTPKTFAADLISIAGRSEFGSVFSKDGTEFFFGVDLGQRSEIRYTRLEGETWIDPIVILSHEKFGYNDPFLSPDEKKLFYISNRSLNGEGSGKDIDIWYSEKTESGWSAPINAGPNINSDKEEYYISFTKDGSMYFSSNSATANEYSNDFDIYRSSFANGEYQKPVRLSDSVNTPSYEADVFIDPDESYIIFCGQRKEGLGRGDLYISFKNDDETWTESKNMGSPINSSNHELCPFVTTDGKYLFYTSNKDIYWVDARIIEQYRSK